MRTRAQINHYSSSILKLNRKTTYQFVFKEISELSSIATIYPFEI